MSGRGGQATAALPKSRRGRLDARNVVFALALGSAAFAFGACRQNAGSGGYLGDDAGPISTWTDAGPPPPSDSTRPLREGEVVFDAPDRAHVDPGVLVAQARSLALRSNPRAVLTQINITPAVAGGVVDTVHSSSSWGYYTFEYSYFDKSRPVGQDKIEGTITVSGFGSHFRVSTLSIATYSHFPGFNPAGGPDPRCTMRQAWQAAVQSGVPGDAVASASYTRGSPMSMDRPFVWSFRIDGHPELRRSVDGSTCGVVDAGRAAGTMAAVPGSPAKSAASPASRAKVGPCGCAAGDLLCAMRCQDAARRSEPVKPGVLVE